MGKGRRREKTRRKGEEGGEKPYLVLYPQKQK